jgi:hypothetical protein
LLFKFLSGYRLGHVTHPQPPPRGWPGPARGIAAVVGIDVTQVSDESQARTGASMTPRKGDVLVSNRKATLVHDLSIVPERPDLSCPNHDSAVGLAREMAKDRGVDAWLTEDQTHFMKIATFRREERMVAK